MNIVFYENRLKILISYLFLTAAFSVYIFITYENIIKSYEINDKKNITLFYDFLNNLDIKENFPQAIYLENPNFIDNKELINELSKSTPLLADLDKENKTESKYSLVIKYYLDQKSTDEDTQNLFSKLNEKDYLIKINDKKIVLWGKLISGAFIILEQNASLDKYEGSISTFFKFIFIFGVLNLGLMFYLLLLIKSGYDEKIFLRMQYEQIQADTKKIAFQDALTGVASRLKFEESLKDLIHIASRFEEQKFCLVMIDIDNFKSVNDTHGHDYGDVVLKEVASTVKAHIRQSDTFARWGGEEFILLLPLIEFENAIVLADKIRNFISEIKFDKLDKITCSFGLAEFKTGDDEKTILKRADEFLYKAKTTGKNKVAF